MGIPLTPSRISLLALFKNGRKSLLEINNRNGNQIKKASNELVPTYLFVILKMNVLYYLRMNILNNLYLCTNYVLKTIFEVYFLPKNHSTSTY